MTSGGRRISSKIRCAAALALTLPLAALAEKPAMKPGLWEYQVKMEMPGTAYAIPPSTSQRCLTQGEINRGEFAKDDECKITNLKQGAGSASYDVACKDGATGHFDFTYGPGSMQGKGVTQSKGRKVLTDFSSKRLGKCPK